MDRDKEEDEIPNGGEGAEKEYQNASSSILSHGSHRSIVSCFNSKGLLNNLHNLESIFLNVDDLQVGDSELSDIYEAGRLADREIPTDKNIMRSRKTQENEIESC